MARVIWGGKRAMEAKDTSDLPKIGQSLIVARLALSIDPLAPDAHARYDAGLVAASFSAATHLAEGRVAHKRGYHYAQERTIWCPSWVLVPVSDTESTIAVYGEDARERLERTLVTQGLASPSELKQQDIGRVMTHWGHTFVSCGTQLHRQSEAAARLAPTSTPNDVLMMTRLMMWRVSADRDITMMTPIHPLWGKRGEMIEINNTPAWSERATSTASSFVKRLLGPNVNIKKSTDGPLVDVMRMAVPELLSVDRGYLAEIDSQPRQKLIEHLRSLESFTPESRKVAVELIADIWDTTNMADTTMALAAEEEGKPGIFDGTVAEVYDAYFQNVIPGDGQPSTEQREILERRMPIMGLLLLRSYLEEDTAMIAVMGKSIQATLKTIVLRTPLSRLSIAAYTAMMDDCTPRDLLATI